MERISINVAICWALAALLVLVTQASAKELPDWKSSEGLDHPLAGKIVNSSGQSVELETLIDAAAQADYVLLGETHDNADHHALQALVISKLGMLAAGRSSTVVFEMLPFGKQETIDRFMTDPDPAKFGEMTGWAKSGWPDWDIYQPIMKAAVDHDMGVQAGSPDREMVRDVGRKGIEALDQDQQKRFGFDIALDDKQRHSLLDAVDKGHCGLMPKVALKSMLWVQRLRDGALGNAMISAREKNGGEGFVFLIAGSGHVRKDHGVPAVIRDREPEAKIISISFREVVAGGNEASHYFDNNSAQVPADDRVFDFIWLTPRTVREDQCEKLRERMGNKG